MMNKFSAVLTVLLLSACGDVTDNKTQESSQPSAITGGQTLDLTGVKGQPMAREANIGSNAFAGGVSNGVLNGTGDLQFPYADQTVQGNLTFSASAEDVDGIESLTLQLRNEARSFNLCEANCGSELELTVFGLNPYLSGAEAGELILDLLITDVLGNESLVATLNLNWQPIEIQGVTVQRQNNVLQINWQTQPDLYRYNVYAATESFSHPSDTSILPNGVQFLAIADNQLQLTDADPTADYFIMVTGLDGGGESGTSGVIAVASQITPVNQAPIVQADAFTGSEDQVVSGNVLLNDSDPENAPLTVNPTLVNQPQHGSLVINSDGTFSYTPEANFSGQDSFTYEASDPIGAAAQGVVTLTLNAVNDAPIAGDDAYSVTTSGPFTVAAPGLLGNDSDLDLDPLAVAADLVEQPQNGTVVINNDGSFTYTPSSANVDQDQFVYQVTDGNGGLDTGVVTVNYNVPNQAPIATNDSYQVAEDGMLTVSAVANGWLANDSDADSETITVAPELLSTPLHGNLQWQTDGTFVYTPNSNFFGVDQFQYQISDTEGATASAFVTIEVTAVSDIPVATDDNYTLNEDTPLTVTTDNGLLINDSDFDGGDLSVELTPISPPQHGQLTIAADGSFVYQPNTDFFGVDSFTYQINNDSDLTNQAMVVLNVMNVNDAPIPTNDVTQVTEDSSVLVDVLSNDTDPDNEALILQSVSADRGEATIEANQIRFTPASNDTATAMLTYHVADPNGVTATGTVQVDVDAVNDAPTAVADVFTGVEDTQINLDVLANDTDPDGDQLTIDSASAEFGSVVVASGVIQYTPTNNYYGAVTVTYTVSDPSGAQSSAVASLTLTSVNDVPVAMDDTAETDEDTAVTISPLTNDSDADLDNLTITAATADSGDVLIVNQNLQYSPASNSNGTAVISYTISDGNGGSSSANIAVTISAVNDEPIAANDSITIDEDTSVSIDVLSNDSDADGDTLSINSASAATGSVSIENNQLSYQPLANENGIDTISYIISDGNGGSAGASVTVNITAVNDLPVANNDTLALDEDTTASINVLTNDLDADADTLTITTATVDSGSVAIVGESLEYTPALNSEGLAVISYSISDGNGGTATANVVVTINGVNDQPIANNDSVAINEESAITIDVLSNDSDVDGDNLTISSASAGSGSVSIVNNQLSYQPQANANGSDTISYTISDGNGGTAGASVTVTITAVNDLPVANNDTLTLDEDTTAVVDVLANDSDVDGDTLSVDAASATSGSVNIVDGALNYTPEPNANGSDVISYTVSDGNGGTDVGTVSVTITAINDTPVAVDDAVTTLEDVSKTINVISNDTDIEDDVLTITAASAVSGTVSIISNQLNYQPLANDNGSDTISYTITDGNGGTASATVTVSITAVNDLPVTNNDSIILDEDTNAVVDVLANDSDVDGDTLSLTTASATLGSVTIVDGSLTYTPVPNSSGNDSVTYNINDGNGGTASGMLSVTINPINDAPIAVADTATSNEDAVATVDVLANDTDLESDALTITSVSAASGSVAIVSNQIQYTPVANANGEVVVNYTISDSNGGTDDSTLTLTISPINDAPIATDDTATTDEDVAVLIDAVANDSDPDGDSLTISSASVVTGTVTVESNQIRFTPAVNATGNETISYVIEDGNGESDTGSIVVTIGGINDAPVAVDDTATVDEDVTASFDLLANDSDIDGDTLTLASVSAEQGTATIVNNELNYVPVADFNGEVVVDYTISDGNGGTDSASLTLTISPVNDAPVAVADNVTSLEDASITINAVANDTDVDGDPLTISNVSVDIGTVSINSNQIEFTPQLNYIGNATISYDLDDGNGGTDSGTVTVDVGGVNDAPVAVDDVVTIDEDNQVTVDVLVNDTDADGNSLVITSVSANRGTVSIVSNKVLYIPDAHDNGTIVVDYDISDGSGGADSGQLTITLNPVNDLPIATNDNITTNEDTLVSIDVLANDTDAEDDTLTITAVSASVGNASIVNGEIEYIPGLNLTGSATITYTVSDGNGGTAQGTVAVTVDAVNDAPVAVDDVASVDEDLTISINAISNDTDVEGDTLTITAATVPTGTVTINNNQLRFTPALNDVGSETISYTVSDGNGGTDTANVVVTINALNDNPVATNDSVTLNEDTLTTLDVLTNDSDVDGDTLTISAASAGTGSVSIVDNQLSYQPLVNANGSDTISYTISDGNGGAASATVSVSITAINDLPVANSDLLTLDEDTTALIDVLANDSDVDGDTLTITAASAATGNVTIVGGQLSYTPALNVFGSDVISYTVSDGNGGTDTGAVNVTISAVNDAPVAVDDVVTTLEDVAKSINVISNDSDADGDVLTLTSVSAISGTASIVSNQINYQPLANANGSDTISYTISDGNGGTANGSVTLSITAVNDMPVANDDTLTLDEDTTALVDALINDTDVDGDTLTLTAASASSGSVTIVDGKLSYTPSLNSTDSALISYTVSDGNGGSDTGSVSITITAINDAPVAVNDLVTTLEDVSKSIDVISNDTDVEGDTLTVTSVSAVTGTVSIANNEINYQPLANAFGSDTISYTISDSNGGTASASVTVTITAVNDVPIANNDSVTIDEDTNVLVDVLANDSDVDGDTLSVTSASAATGNVSIVDGKLSYTPALNHNGSDGIAYNISDGNGGTASGTLSVTINAINDAPVAVADAFSSDEDVIATFDVLANDTDAENDSLTITAASAATGSVAIIGNQLQYTPVANANGDTVISYTVSDGNGGTDDGSLTLTLNPINDAPELTGAVFAVDEDASDGISLGTVTATDVESDNLTFSIIGGDSGLFNIDSTTGVISVSGSSIFNFELQIQHQIIVDVTDDGTPNLSDTAQVTINVNDVAEPEVPTEIANFGRTAHGELELNGQIVQGEFVDSVYDDSKLFVVGYQTVAGDTDIVITSYDPNGALNTSFGTNGVQTFDFGADEKAFAIVENGDLYVGYTSDDGTNTEICIMKMDTFGTLDADSGLNDSGRRCTSENTTLVAHDMANKSSTYYIVGSRHGVTQDSVWIKFDNSLLFEYGSPLFTDVSGSGLNNEATAIFIADGDKAIITGNVESPDGDTDIYIRYVDKAYVSEPDFNAGSPLFIDIQGNGNNDNAIEVGGDRGASFLAHVVGSTELSNGKTDAAVIVVDKDGTLISTVDGDGIATYDIDGDGGAGTKDSLFTDVQFELDNDGDDYDLIVSGEIIDSTGRQFFTTRLGYFDGTIDTSYGNNGVFTATYDDDVYATGLTLEDSNSTDRSWITGYRTFDDGNYRTPTFTAVTDSGTAYNSFDNDGEKVFNVSDDNPVDVIELAVAPNQNKLLTAAVATEDGKNHIILTRYLSDGTLDSSFGSAGIHKLEFNSSYAAKGLMEQSDGKVIVFGTKGTNNKEGFVMRVSADGDLDSSFSGNGSYVTTDITASAIEFYDAALTNSGKIVAVGTHTDNSVTSALILRLTPDGELDGIFDAYDGVLSSFTSNGYVIANSTDTYRAVVVDSSSAVYVAGTRLNGDTSHLLTKYTAAGSIDIGFGTEIVDVAPSNDEYPVKIMVNSDNRLVVVGNTEGTVPAQVSVLVYSKFGSAITAFSGDGQATFTMSPSAQDAVAYDAALDSNDNILVTGYSDVSGTKHGMIGRITSSGVLDVMFDDVGHFQATTCNNDSEFQAIELLSDTNVLVVGSCAEGDEMNNAVMSQFGLWEDGIEP